MVHGLQTRIELSDRIQSVTPSSTLAISAIAKELKEKGYDIIGLGVGEPDFNTPKYIIDAATKALVDGHTKYTASAGISELKDAIINKFNIDNQLNYKRDEVIVTTGAKYGLYAVFQTLLNDGDEVIIPSPFWVSYPEHVKLAGGKPIYVESLEVNDFKMTPDQLQLAITDKTKAIIINSPNNPTGMMYSKEELQALGDICLRHNLIIISDEIYEKLVYTKEAHISIASLSDDFKERTVVINGVSKSHAMTGWRIGYAAGPANIIQAMTNHASHAISNPTSVAQYAALEAYRNEVENKHLFTEMQTVFKERLDLFYNLINEIPGISCKKPSGAFYIFPNVKEAVRLNGFLNVEDWVHALLEEEKVALVPGSGFGAPNNVRLSYATSTDMLIEAAKRIKRFVANHQ